MTEWAPNENDLKAAEDDLEWFFAQAAAALGERGSGFEGSGATAWDAEKIWALFLQHRQKERRDSVQRWYRVAPVMRALPRVTFTFAEQIYRPFPWSADMRRVFFVERAAAGVVTLAGVAVRARATEEAYRKAHASKGVDGHPRLAPTVPTLIAWADNVLQQSKDRDAKGRLTRVPKWAAAALDEAHAIRTDVLTVYAHAEHASKREGLFL